MSGSSPGGGAGGDGGAFPPVDESLAKILPGFGSTPITPEDGLSASDSLIAHGNISPTAAEQIAAFEPTWWPSDQALVLLNYLHELSGFDCYAYTIGATTIAFRVLLFPLFANAQVNSSRMAHMQPELNVLKQKIDQLGNRVDQETQQKYMQSTKALFAKYQCNPFKSMIAPLASAPIFMSMFFALRNAPEVVPDLLTAGGLLWFPDLTVPDPYLALPVLSAGTFLLMTETGKEQMMASDPARGKMMVNVFRALAVAMIPLTMNFNSGVFVYWSCNNLWSLGQTLFLKQAAVRKYLGIWDPPKPIPGQENKSFMDEIQNLVNRNKEKEEPNAWAADRVKAHNEIIEQQKIVKRKLMEKEGIVGEGDGKRRSN